MLMIYHFYKSVKCFANVEAIKFDIKCNTLSGNCLIQIDNMLKALFYIVSQLDSLITGLHNLINTKQDSLSTQTGDGVDLLYSPSVLSKVLVEIMYQLAGSLTQVIMRTVKLNLMLI